MVFWKKDGEAGGELKDKLVRPPRTGSDYWSRSQGEASSTDAVDDGDTLLAKVEDKADQQTAAAQEAVEGAGSALAGVLGLGAATAGKVANAAGDAADSVAEKVGDVAEQTGDAIADGVEATTDAASDVAGSTAAGVAAAGAAVAGAVGLQSNSDEPVGESSDFDTPDVDSPDYSQASTEHPMDAEAVSEPTIVDATPTQEQNELEDAVVYVNEGDSSSYAYKSDDAASTDDDAPDANTTDDTVETAADAGSVPSFARSEESEATLSDEQRDAIEAVRSETDSTDEALTATAAAGATIAATAYATRKEPEIDELDELETVEADVVETPRADAAEYYYSETPAPAKEDGEGRKAALYLAGAASLSAICAAVYFLLPQQRSEEGVSTNTLTADAPSVPVVETNDGTIEVAGITPDVTAPITDDTEIYSNLDAATDSFTDDTVIVPDNQLFAEEPEVDLDAPAVPGLETNELKAEEFALSTPDVTTPVDPPAALPDLSTTATDVAEPAPVPVVEPPVTAEPDPMPEPATELASVTQTEVPPRISIGDTSTSFPAPAASLSSSTSAPTAAPSAPPEPVPEPSRAAADLPGFTGEIANNGIAALALSAIEAQTGPLPTQDRTRIANSLHSAFTITPNGQSYGLTSVNGDRITSRFHTTNTADRSVDVVRTPDVILPTDNVVLQDGWYVARDSATLRVGPDRTSATKDTLSGGTLMQRIATISSPDGDRWYAMGSEGVIVGYLHASESLPANVAARVGDVWSGDTFGAVPDSLQTQTTARTFTLKAGNQTIEGEGYLGGQGQWIIDGTNTSLASTSGQLTTSGATSFGGLSPEIADILFGAGASRRNERHGVTETQERLDALMDDGGSVRLVSPDGRTQGHIHLSDSQSASAIKRLVRAGSLKTLPSDLTAQSGQATSRYSVQLQSVPNGDIIPNAIVPTGMTLQTLAISSDSSGASWTLVGVDGVAVGFAPTRALKATSIVNLSAPTNASLADEIVSDAVELKVACKTASFERDASIYKSVRVCQQANGHWKVTPESQPSMTASIDVEPEIELASLEQAPRVSPRRAFGRSVGRA